MHVADHLMVLNKKWGRYQHVTPPLDAETPIRNPSKESQNDSSCVSGNPVINIKIVNAHLICAGSCPKVHS